MGMDGGERKRREPDWIEERGGCVRLRIRVQPRASRTELAGEYGGALRVRVAAPPVDGEANDELTRWLAKTLGVARSRVRIVAGEAGRTKTIEIGDASAAAVLDALAEV